MTKATPQHKPTAGNAGVLANIAHRPRLLAGAALMVVAYFLASAGLREATRLLIAWNVGAWAFLIMIAAMVADPKRDARVQARPEDENQWVLVALEIVASCAALAAIIWELGPIKEMAALPKAEHLSLVGATVFVVGCIFASSDVNLTSKRMRRICVIQGLSDSSSTRSFWR